MNTLHPTARFPVRQRRQFAGHFAPALMMQAINIYRVGFRPSAVLGAPKVMVGVQIVAADSDERAEVLATTNYQRFLRIIRNQRVSLRPPTHMDTIWSPAERDIVKNTMRTAIIGGPQKVKLGMQKLVDQTGADELMIISDTYELRDRLHSFALIAQAVQ